MDIDMIEERRQAQQTAALLAVAAGATWAFTFVLYEMVTAATMFGAGDAEAPWIALLGAIGGLLFVVIAGVSWRRSRRLASAAATSA